MRYLDIYTCENPFWSFCKARGPRDAKLACSVHRQIAEPSIDLYCCAIAAASTLHAACNRCGPGARETRRRERNKSIRHRRCDSDAQEEARREPRARGFV